MAKEIPLTGEDEAAAYFSCPPTSILIGGQALALWVEVFKIPLPKLLEAGVTKDVDFLGGRDDANEHAEFLKAHLAGSRLRPTVVFPDPFEPTPNSAKITVYAADEASVAAEIDYLSTVAGYVGEEERRLRDRAIAIENVKASGTTLTVMHPFDCLRSRLANVQLIPSKRNKFHLAQAALSIDVLRAYLEKEIESGAPPKDVLLPVTEQVFRLATSRAGLYAFDRHEIDVIAALPSSGYPQVFGERRQVQAMKYINRRRKGRKGGRMSSLRNSPESS